MANVASVNLRRIAEAAGVSHMTVSRVLRGGVRVAAATRERVLREAERLGYRPNPLVQAYAAQIRRSRVTQQSNACNLAWLTSDPEGIAKKRPWGVAYLKGAAERADAVGFPLDTTIDAHGMGDERLERLLINRGIRGILIPHQLYHERHPFQSPHMAEVGIGENPDARPMHTLTTDCFKNVTTCVDGLLASGYRRIGYCEHNHSTVMSQGMHWGAFLFNQKRLDVRLAPLTGISLIGRAGESSRREFLRWIEKAKPDAVIVTFYQAGEWLRDAGIAVPGRLGLAHLALTEDVAGWSGIDPLPGQIGAAAVDLLVSNILHNEYGVPEHPRVQRLPGRWVQGATTRPIPKMAGTLPASHNHPYEWFENWFWK